MSVSRVPGITSMIEPSAVDASVFDVCVAYWGIRNRLSRRRVVERSVSYQHREPESNPERTENHQPAARGQLRLRSDLRPDDDRAASAHARMKLRRGCRS